ncbi:MAG: helix-turn-helix domain-containing protein [Pseudomonadota bacterium]
MGDQEQVFKTQLLDNGAAARYLGISPGTLNNWRAKGEGPKVTHMGRLIRYHIRELEKYIALQTRTA